MSFLRRLATIRGVLALGLLARLGFLAVGARLVWGAARFRHADAHAYVNAAINLVSLGTYTSDPTFHEALFSRVPGYSLFWAAHYLVLGEARAYAAVAVTQILLDTASIYLLYLVARRALEAERPALVAALLYAVYPFALFWVTPTAPDTLSMFLLLVVLWLLYRAEPSTKNALLVGAAAAVLTLTREYLGVVVLGAALHWWLRRRSLGQFLRVSAVAGLAFVVVFAPWPLRNRLLQHEAVLLRSPSSGSRFYTEDFRAAWAWMQGWSTYAEPYLMDIANGRGDIAWPPGAIADEAERAKVGAAVARARACGSGFAQWGHRPESIPEGKACDAEVAAEFRSLEQAYRARHPVGWLLDVPLRNLAKVYFKTELMQGAAGGAKKLLVTALFGWRTLLRLLGLVGAIVLWRRRGLWPILLTVFAVDLFMCFVFRGLQMRYLLQGDALLLVPAAALVDAAWTRLRRRPAPAEAA